jgi:glycopeptide antibiotics resistance protein
MAAILAVVTGAALVYGRRQGRFSKADSWSNAQAVSLSLLTSYVFLVFASTVFSRTPKDSYTYELFPFWSYREILRGIVWAHGKIWRVELFWEDLFNVFMLLPVGVLAPVVLARGGNEQTPAGNNGRMECEENTLSESRVENAVSTGSRKVFRRVILLGFFTSLTIEILQLVAKRGLFEFDDIFHNTLGVAIGYWIWRKGVQVQKRISGRMNAHPEF